MLAFPSIFVVFAACAVLVDAAPQNDIGFPDESEGPEGDDLGNRQGFRPRPGVRQQGFRPQQGGFGPQQGGFGPQQGGFRPQQGGFGPQQGGFRPQQGFRPPGGNVGSPGFPGNNIRPSNFPGGNIGSSGLQGNNFGSNPGGNFGSSNIPGGNFGTSGLQGNNFGTSNTRPVTNQSPNTNFQSGNAISPSGTQGGNNFQNTGNQSQTPVTTTTAAPTSQTTTRIPPRDPTNRIVYIVPCPCNYTREYSPVCGTDGQTYGNLSVLRCTQTCGKDVKIFLMGACVGNRGG